MRFWYLIFTVIVGSIVFAQLFSDHSKTCLTNESNVRLTEQLILQKINEVRVANSLEPLEWDPVLAKAARAHSEDMAKRHYFSHTTPKGLEPWDRAIRAGYGSRYVGENLFMLAFVDATYTPEKVAEETVKSWFNSEGHRRIMLSPEWREAGIGIYMDRSGSVYVTAMFGVSG